MVDEPRLHTLNRSKGHGDVRVRCVETISGGGVLVLRDDGQLVRYLRGDPDHDQPVSVVNMTIGLASVAAASSEGSFLVVALADGTVARLDPETFALDRMASVAGAPIWIAPCEPFSFVVVTRASPVVHGISIIARDTRRVRSFAVPDAPVPSALAVDGDTLWFGSSNQLFCIALGTGATTKVAVDIRALAGVLIKPAWGKSDSHGFRTRLRSKVLAYGGSPEGISVVVDASDDPRTVWRNDEPRRGPIEPIRLLLPSGRGFHAIAGSAYYSVDAELTQWNVTATIPNEVVPDASAGHFSSTGGKLMFATARDGLFVLQGRASGAIHDPPFRIVPLASVHTRW